MFMGMKITKTSFHYPAAQKDEITWGQVAIDYGRDFFPA